MEEAYLYGGGGVHAAAAAGGGHGMAGSTRKRKQRRRGELDGALPPVRQLPVTHSGMLKPLSVWAPAALVRAREYEIRGSALVEQQEQGGTIRTWIHSIPRSLSTASIELAGASVSIPVAGGRVFILTPRQQEEQQQQQQQQQQPALRFQAASAEECLEWAAAIRRAARVVTRDDLEAVAVLGSGHWSEVLLAKISTDRTATDRCVAVKQIRLERFSKMEHILSERILSARLPPSPFVTAMRFSFLEQGILYLGYEYCAGGDLLSVFSRLRRALSVEEARWCLAQVVAALEHMHTHGFLHRDVKAENVFIDAAGFVKLGDVNLATQWSEDDHNDRRQHSSSSHADGDDANDVEIVGTEAYFAPELVMRLRHGPSVDVWALGCLVYELLTGSLPFDRKGKHNRRVLILSGAAVVDLDALRPLIGATPAQDLLARLLHPSPRRRMLLRRFDEKDQEQEQERAAAATGSRVVVDSDSGVKRNEDSEHDNSNDKDMDNDSSGDDNSLESGSASSLWQAVRAHPFFSGQVDWAGLADRTATPPPDLVPPSRSFDADCGCWRDASSSAEVDLSTNTKSTLETTRSGTVVGDTRDTPQQGNAMTARPNTPAVQLMSGDARSTIASRLHSSSLVGMCFLADDL